MSTRVGPVLQQALGLSSTTPSQVLHWLGTFHGVGPRLLSDYAPHFGLSENFTALDRGDAVDLLGMETH